MSWVYCGMGAYGLAMAQAVEGGWAQMLGFIVVGTILISRS